MMLATMSCLISTPVTPYGDELLQAPADRAEDQGQRRARAGDRELAAGVGASRSISETPPSG